MDPFLFPGSNPFEGMDPRLIEQPLFGAQPPATPQLPPMPQQAPSPAAPPAAPIGGNIPEAFAANMARLGVTPAQLGPLLNPQPSSFPGVGASFNPMPASGVGGEVARDAEQTALPPTAAPTSGMAPTAKPSRLSTCGTATASSHSSPPASASRSPSRQSADPSHPSNAARCPHQRKRGPPRRGPTDQAC